LQKPDGSRFAKVTKEELDLNIAKWPNMLVGYLLDGKPFYLHLKVYVAHLWEPKCSLEIHFRENNFFFPPKFGTKDEK